jgi:hypothetical protein
MAGRGLVIMRIAIVLPKYLNYSVTRALLAKKYSTTLASNVDMCVFDWQLTEGGSWQK